MRPLTDQKTFVKTAIAPVPYKMASERPHKNKDGSGWSFALLASRVMSATGTKFGLKMAGKSIGHVSLSAAELLVFELDRVL